MSWYKNLKQAQQQNVRYLATLHADVWVPILPDKAQEIENAKAAIRNSVRDGDGTLKDSTLYNTRFETDVQVQPYD